jgi:cytochrome b6-f complex iron-sulfur subunit
LNGIARSGESGVMATKITKPDDHGLTRRTFLAVVGSATAAAGCSSPAVSPAPVGEVQAGSVSMLAVGSLAIVGAEAVCIGRDTGGVYAMTLTCTHAGCDIGQRGTVSADGLVCDCHGSAFDANGNVTRGPATQPLDHFGVTVDANGTLTIHGDEIVDAGQRLSV